MISVIIPAKNASATIGATLSSLAADRALIGEILLVDDGSDDDTVAKAEEAAHNHALPLKVTGVQLGSAGAARNAGLAQARGDYIFFLDADDEVIPGAVTLLRDALRANPQAGLAVGASIHRASEADKLKIPSDYGSDRQENARKYLANELRSITVGSALVAASEAAAIRFPESIGLDEDTLYWAAILTRVSVTTIDRPVLFYNLDEARMAQRFISSPRRVFLDIALELNKLAAFGIGKRTLRKRKVFIAQRIARHLIRRNHYLEAAGIMRVVRTHAGLRPGLKALQYRMRIGIGRIAQLLGYRKPVNFWRAPADRNPPRRTLVLTADPAFPPVSGADLRNYQNAKAAMQFGPVLLVSAAPGNGQMPADGNIRTAALTRQGEPQAASLVHRRPSIEMRIPRPALPRLLALVRAFRPETIIVEGIPIAALLKHLRPVTPRLILDMHNVESDLAAQVRRAKSLPERLLPLAWSDRGRIQRLEREALAMVDRVWVCSDADREKLNSLFAPGIPVDIVPNGIPRSEEMPAALPALPGEAGGWPVMLFVGHLGYEPNETAVERLVYNILPKVRQALPSARVILAGRDPGPAVQDLASLPGVELAANPDDLSGLFGQSHLSVVPLSAGGGTRFKILEAMAWGLPVIATPIAAEGTGLEDGEEILIAETDDALARSVIALCAEPERLEQQRRLAYKTVMLRFGPSVIEAAVRKGLGGV
jgi:glycosyltransferase involved in cell wall biosynthesis